MMSNEADLESAILAVRKLEVETGKRIVILPTKLYIRPSEVSLDCVRQISNSTYLK